MVNPNREPKAFMPHSAPDAIVRLDLLPDHLPAVTALLSGPDSAAARTVLLSHGFHDTGEHAMILARIDREEPYYTQRAAEDLLHHGYTATIDPALQEEIDTEWTWDNHPMPGLTRDEIRQVGAAAQEIHDDIAAGRLAIHLHARDGWTTVAVGSYNDGRHVHLHGENHLRVISSTHDSDVEAVAEFHRLHSVAVRPGPAAATDTERAVAAALAHRTPQSAPASQDPQGAADKQLPAPAPVHEADPRAGEALLESFFEDNPDWWKVRTWSDETTIACHESLAMRVEFDHEARHRGDVAWTVAVYDSPVGDRLWYATASATTPTELVQALLESLTSNEPWWGLSPAGVALRPIDATRALLEASWTRTSRDRHTAWQAPDGNSTMYLDSYAAEHPASRLPAWTVIGGTDPNRPAWAIELSPTVTPDILAHLTDQLAARTPMPTTLHRAGTPPLPTAPVAATTTQTRARHR